MRKLWIANVHDPKVAAYDLELFMDMAWDINAVSGSTLGEHLNIWLCRQFGTEAGTRLRPAMYEFYRLCGERRPEFMGFTQVELDKTKYHRGLSQVGNVSFTRHEAAERMSAFSRIKANIIEAQAYIRPELADAFFAAIKYPVWAASAINTKILADSAESHRAYQEIQALTQQYNEMNGGKWRHLMNAAPRQLPVFENVRGRLNEQRKPEYTILTPKAIPSGAETIQMLGHSMESIALPKNGTLTYELEIETDGDYVLATSLIPTHPIDSGDLRFSVSIDGDTPKIYSLKEPFRSERWKTNVLCGQTNRKITTHLSRGRHSLVIKALDEHIVVDRVRFCIFSNDNNDFVQ
jgi:hypothetical protein